MKILLTIGLLMITAISHAQNTGAFIVETKWVDRFEIEKQLTDSALIAQPFFEDDDYVVSITCRGEFGGTLTFTSKKKNERYICRATCPIIVNKLAGKYFVTIALDHMNGSTSVIRIDDPKELQKIEAPSQPASKPTLVGARGASESKSVKGSVTIVDSMGLLSLVSFLYNGELLHITTDYKKTYVSRVENARFIHLQEVSSVRLGAMEQKAYRRTDGHYIVPLTPGDRIGLLDIVENRITLLISK